jgi:tRNA dimethylallyltransferase
VSTELKLPLLVIVGPTAVGKTALSIAVAKRLGAEIISGDSMQLYRTMDIGTAKVTHQEMQGVPHHMIDICDPDQPFSVARFQERVGELIRAIYSRGRLPILSGGTGLYVRAVIQPYTFAPAPSDQAVRDQLSEEEQEHGPGHLHRRLAAVDPAAASKLHPNDLRRLIRALEVFSLTGTPISQTQTADQGEPRYDLLYFGLTRDRKELYKRIDQRVDAMLEAGWLEETRRLLSEYSPQLTPLQAIGYRELVQYMRGLLTKSEAIPLIKRHTRQFAKRQLTWFNRERHLCWIDLTKTDLHDAVDLITRKAEGKWPSLVEAR